MNPVRALRHALTLTWRSLLKIKHSPEQLLDITLQPIFFVVLFVFLFGGAISSNWRIYLQYLLPGILIQTAFFCSLAPSTPLNVALTRGIFDRFRSLPVARPAPMLGAILGDVVRYLTSGAVVLAFGAVLGFRIRTGVAPTLAAYGLVLILAIAACWVSALVGIIAKSPQSVQGIGGIAVFTLTFGSNVFVPTRTLPGWLQAWVKINPVSALSDALRGLLLGGPVATPVTHTLIGAAVITAVFAPLTIWAYIRRT